jgi:hypothetical protein
VELIADSTVQARGFVGYIDCADEEPFWRPPRSQVRFWEVREGRLHEDRFTAPDDNLARCFEHLEQVPGRVPAGSFIFVVSDFLVSPTDDVWADALERRWDIVPVVIQDPVWEQSFPDVASVVVPITDPRNGSVSLVRLGAAEARERRTANERRRERLFDDFETIGLEPVAVDTSEREEILQSFLDWSEGREYRWARGW